MKRKRIVWLVIVLLVMVIAIFAVIRPKVLRQRLTGQVGPPNSIRKSAMPAVDSMSNKSNETKGNQPELSTDAQNLNEVKFCVQQWRQELMSIEDALRCIDRYMANQDSPSS